MKAFALQRAAKGGRATDAALLRELIQAECAAAEIELRFVSLHLGFQVGGDCIQVLLAALFGFEQPRFAHDAQMPGHVVLRNLQAFGNTRDVQLLLEEQAQDAQPRPLAQSLERRDASQSRQCDEYNRTERGEIRTVLLNLSSHN